MSCLDCGEGFHELCSSNCGVCHFSDESGDSDSQRMGVSIDEEGEERAKTKTPKKHGRRTTNDLNLKDQQSTGRKRAAKLFPLDPDAPCEWRNQANCGGGEKPIVGCTDGFHQARHHGPDKNTLYNEEGNVHRICFYCHNRWHADNDPTYVPEEFHEPHNPRTASEEDQKNSELRWSNVQLLKIKD